MSAWSCSTEGEAWKLMIDREFMRRLQSDIDRNVAMCQVARLEIQSSA